MTFLKTLFAGALVAVGFAGPVYAQASKGPDVTPMEQYEMGQKQERDAIDRQYKSAVQKTRGNAPSQANDPWANMRSDPDAKSKAKR